MDLKSKLILVWCLYYSMVSNACTVDFGGTANLDYSDECGGATQSELKFESDPIGDNDSFTFDSPSNITITGDWQIKASGGGTVIIPAGVTVTVEGNFQIESGRRLHFRR